MNFLKPSYIPDEIENQFKEYAGKCYPNEACAYVIENKLVPVENVHEDPKSYFQLSMTDSLLQTKAQAFLHSHPDGQSVPSEDDMITQIACGLPFGICSSSSEGGSNIIWWGDHLLDYPLIERPFIHGSLDCYSIVRSVYWQKKQVKIMDFARNDQWWDSNQNLYSDNFQKAGFSEVNDLQLYDVFLMKINKGPISHAAVYMGGTTLIHHLSNKVSREDNMNRWGRFIEKTVRYNG